MGDRGRVRVGERGGEREFGRSLPLFWSVLFVWIGWMMTMLIWNLVDWITVCPTVLLTACKPQHPHLSPVPPSPVVLSFFLFFFKAHSTSFTHEDQFTCQHSGCSGCENNCPLSSLALEALCQVWLNNWWCHCYVIGVTSTWAWKP